jgi:acetate kinase
MKILVINCGSSSIKYRVFRDDGKAGPVPITGGTAVGLGQDGAALIYEHAGGYMREELRGSDHGSAMAAIIELLVHPQHGGIRDLSEVGLVAHRTVHGGEGFNCAVMIDQQVIDKMERCIPLAPIHNPANLEGIRQALELLPGARQVAVFDTAFHQSLPPRAYMYAIPYELYQRHGVRKYGFHGTSCRYVTQQAAKLMGRSAESLKMVICHIGNGVTVAAVEGGQSVDTSLGFTPLEGAMMGTRCGDLDPGVVLYLQRELGMELQEVDEMLNRESGLLGVSGQSNDMRAIIQASQEGDRRSALAVEMFTYRLKKYIGAYAAAMGGVDLVAFTGGIGENSPLIRKQVLQGLAFMGIELDSTLNENAGRADSIISSEQSAVSVMVVHTQEELMIAREALALWQEEYAEGCAA